MKIPDALLDRPFEVLVGFLCLEAGLMMAITGISTNAVTALLPVILIRVWGLTLALGGGLLLSGVYLRYFRNKFIEGLLVERAGYYPLISGTLCYSVIIIMQAGWTGTFPAFTYIVFAAVCALRYTRVNQMIQQLRRLEQDERR
jgi:hypothetical protein